MATFKKIVANVLSTDFRKACQIVTATKPVLKANEVLVRARYAGINATDINVTAGRYAPGQETPFDVGLEGIVVCLFHIQFKNKMNYFGLKILVIARDRMNRHFILYFVSYYILYFGVN